MLASLLMIMPLAPAAAAGSDTPISFSVSPSVITLGQPATLTWSSPNALFCVASGDWTGNKSASGSQTITPTSVGAKSYSLTCGNASVSLSVTTPPSATITSFTVYPTVLTVGQTAILNWSSTNAAACTASGDWSGAKSASGSDTVKPASAGTKTYTLVCGSASKSILATVNAPGAQPGFDPAHPAEGIWGLGFGAAELSNLIVDHVWAGPVAYSFVPTQSASITHWHGWTKTYFAASYLSAWQSGAPSPDGAVYGWGSGGDVRLKIFADNNGKPGSPVSASEVRMYHLLWNGTDVKPTTPIDNGTYYGDYKRFEKWAFPTPIPVTAGTKYWLVFTNVDPDPANNYPSVNNFWKASGPLAATNQAWRFTSGAWQKYTNDFPISEVYYDNGMVDGPGHAQANNSGGSGSIKLTPTAGIREVWTQVGDVRVGNFGLRVKLEAGSGMRLSVYENGVALVSGVADTATVYPADDEGYIWRSFPFFATFKNGKSYRVEIFGAPGAQWASAVMNKGASYGFTGHFNGYAEYTTNSGSTWNDWTQWGNPSGHAQNLSFYFDFVGGPQQ
jgi:hypothetical protein